MSLVVTLADDPPWPAVRTAAGYARDEDARVLLALGTRAHVLGVLAGALCGLDCVALVGGNAVSMLDLEAHRLGTRAHLCVGCVAALHQARALGVAADRLHALPIDADARRGDALAALLRSVAQTGVRGR